MPRGYKKEIRPGVWRLGGDAPPDPVTGRRRQRFRTVTAKTEREADRKLIAFLAELQAEGWAEPAKVTVEEFLHRWLVTSVDGRVSEGTLRAYRREIRGHLIPNLGKHRLAAVTGLLLDTYYARQRKEGRKNGKGGLSETTLQFQHGLLTQAFAQAVRWKLLRSNPCADAQRPQRSTPKPKALTLEESRRLLAACADHWLYPAVLLAASLGLRRGEVLGLMWEAVALIRRVDGTFTGTLKVVQSLGPGTTDPARRAPKGSGPVALRPPKTEAGRRTLPLGDVAAAALVQHRARQAKERLLFGPGYQDGGWVFAQADGSPITTSQFSHAWRLLADRTGFPGLRFHDLRHSHLSQLLAEGHGAPDVAARAGHSSATVTLDLYGHSLAGSQDRLTETTERLLRGEK
jgi:integrase